MKASAIFATLAAGFGLTWGLWDLIRHPWHGFWGLRLLIVVATLLSVVQVVLALWFDQYWLAFLLAATALVIVGTGRGVTRRLRQQTLPLPVSAPSTAIAGVLMAALWLLSGVFALGDR